MPDIVDTAINAGTFTSLVAAVTAAGLDSTLKSPGPFTVFAPTDEAFSKLPSGMVEALLQDILTLRKVLEYHIVVGKVMAEDVLHLEKATTTEGSDLKISTTEGVKVDGAAIVIADVEAENGVIHVIDTVLLPPSVSL
jgi:uncharacterized surface protein with fasciclin (FAS1) repeats